MHLGGEKDALFHFICNTQCAACDCCAFDHCYFYLKSARRVKKKNEKLKFVSRELLSILLAAAATALCVIIDIVTKEIENEKTK